MNMITVLEGGGVHTTVGVAVTLRFDADIIQLAFRETDSSVSAVYVIVR